MKMKPIYNLLLATEILAGAALLPGCSKKEEPPHLPSYTINSERGEPSFYQIPVDHPRKLFPYKASIDLEGRVEVPKTVRIFNCGTSRANMGVIWYFELERVPYYFEPSYDIKGNRTFEMPLIDYIIGSPSKLIIRTAARLVFDPAKGMYVEILKGSDKVPPTIGVRIGAAYSFHKGLYTNSTDSLNSLFDRFSRKEDYPAVLQELLNNPNTERGEATPEEATPEEANAYVSILRILFKNKIGYMSDSAYESWEDSIINADTTFLENLRKVKVRKPTKQERPMQSPRK